jgi:hypothetical protein
MYYTYLTDEYEVVNRGLIIIIYRKISLITLLQLTELFSENAVFILFVYNTMLVTQVLYFSEKVGLVWKFPCNMMVILPRTIDF